MAVNGKTLYKSRPIVDMLETKQYENGVSFGKSEAGYDIRIKQNIFFAKDWFGRRFVERFDIDSGKEYLASNLKRRPGRFIIASTMEEFCMPDNLLGVVHDKSSWARQGLSIFNTVIEPGWKGFLTLELVYHGSGNLFIPAGSGIAQVVFSKVSDPIAYQGRYQNQKNEPVEAIKA
jgi:dCTP deaminase